jgi:hypothetical protein
LKECQECLANTGRLYKDPSINTAPIILRSLSAEGNELRCTFERPHAFLNDPGDTSKGKSRIHKVVDPAGCNVSEIVIRGTPVAI